MEKIINSHIEKGNIIISDAATCYSWFDEINSGYTHHVHNHGHGDFGENIDSISHIEQLWHNLKFYIKKIYYLIPSTNFVLFLKEAEWRRNQKKFDNKVPFESFEETLKYANNARNNKLYDVDYLKKLTFDS